MLVDNKGHIPLSYSTPPTCLSSCNLHLFQIFISSPRYPLILYMNGNYEKASFYSECCTPIPLFIFVQLLYRKYSGNFFVNLLGKWKESEYSGGQFVPVGGLAYYVTAPARLKLILFVFHLLFYGSVHQCITLGMLDFHFLGYFLFICADTWFCPSISAAWQTWQQIPSMLCFIWCSCFQPVPCFQKLGLKFLVLLPRMWLSSSRYPFMISFIFSSTCFFVAFSLRRYPRFLLVKIGIFSHLSGNL